MVHVPLRRVNGEISRRLYVIVMAALFVLQAGLSTELLAECVGLGTVLLVSARIMVPKSQRSRVNYLIVETAIAGLIAIVVASPFFYYALFSGGLPKGTPSFSDTFGLDFLNPFFPTSTTWLGHHDFGSLGVTYEHDAGSETDGYLGIPIIVAFLLWAFGYGRGRLLARLLLIAAGVSFVAALGSHLYIAGQQTVTLPYSWVNQLPLFDNVVPSRIVLFTALAVAIGVASWLAVPTGHIVGRWLVVILGAVLIFPYIVRPSFGVPVNNPSFFSTDAYRGYLRHDETVLVLPFGGNDMSMLWQAETGFYFYMPEGYVSSVVPSSFALEPTAGQLVGNLEPSAAALDSFIGAHKVSHVVVDPVNAGPWPGLLAQLGFRVRSIGGVLLYAVPSVPPPGRLQNSHVFRAHAGMPLR